MTNAMKQDTQFKVAKLNICPYYGNKVQIDCNGTMCNIQSTSATASRLSHVLHGAGRGVGQAEGGGGGGGDVPVQLQDIHRLDSTVFVSSRNLVRLRDHLACMQSACVTCAQSGKPEGSLVGWVNRLTKRATLWGN